MSPMQHPDAVWELLHQQTEPWDVLVVGGGITGVGILREAARAGYRALLLEQRDFSWGSSSRSSKMVHGGLRYIAQGDIRLTRHSVQERERLLAEVPGLVDRLGYLFTHRKGQGPGRFLMRGLLSVYDALAGVRSARFFNKDALLQSLPQLNPEGLQGASFYSDAVTDDARLVLRVLHEALRDGAVAGNYLAAGELLRDAAGQVQGVQVTHTESGASQLVRARVVINATGAWVDYLRAQVAHENTIRPLRGSHLVLPRSKAPVNDALTLFHPEDRRPVFIFPWEGCTVVGTTDLDHPVPLNTEPAITPPEIDYLLTVVQSQFPAANIGVADIISTWAGVRPVISKSRSKDPSKEKRDHAVWAEQGLVSVSGGKLTTFRLIALDTLKAAQQWLPSRPLSQAAVMRPTTLSPAQLPMLEPALAQRLIGRYGEAVLTMLAQASEAERQPLAGTRFTLMELAWCLQQEAVVHLDDLLLRRTRLGNLLPEGGAALFEQIEPLCRQHLGWDTARWQAECSRYRALWQRSYSVPGQADAGVLP